MRQSDDFWAWMVIAPLWSASLWRLRSAIRQPEARILWYVITALAVAMTARLSTVGVVLFDLTRIDDFATLAKHLAGVGAVAMLLRWVLVIIPGAEDGQPEPRYRRAISSKPRRIVTWAATAVITAVFPWANRQPGPGAEDADFIFVQAGHFWGSLHLVLFYLYVAFGLSCAAIMCADAGRRDRVLCGGRTTVLGRGLQTMAVGCAVGVFYGALRIAYLVVRLCHREFIGGNALVYMISTLALLLCIMLVLFGCCSPALEKLDRAMATHEAIARLRPMWALLTAEAPGVVLDSRVIFENTGGYQLPRPQSRTRRRLKLWYRALPLPPRARRHWRKLRLNLREFWNWRDLDWRLRRRVIEICDSALVLEGYVPTARHEEAAEITRSLPPTAKAAFLLRSAVQHKRAGGEPETARHRRALIRLDNDDLLSGARTLRAIWDQMTSRAVLTLLRRR